MISEYELANIITGATRAEGGVARKSSATILGKAVEDSENGMVRVVPEGDVFAPDGDNTIIIPTSPSVRAGDTVQIGLVGGVSKRPMVVAAGGEGDRQDSSIASAAHAAQVAWNYADSAHTAANQAKTAAQNAEADAARAEGAANQAVEDAGTAKEAAEQAVEDAGTAYQAAHDAQTSADNAATAASNAQTSATAANTAAQEAKADAASAATAASNAQASATQANTHANSALTQLSIIEDVAGTLDWISKHGTYTLTSDTTVQEGTVYFEKVGNDYIPIAEPTGNPHAQGWYTLDVTDSQSDYIMAHLAVTSAGLWVLPSGIGSATDEQHAAGYKTLLSSDGMTIYDDTGRAVATYGEGITFDSSRALKIGNNNAYIEYYDSNGDEVADSLRISANSITLGGSDIANTYATKDEAYELSQPNLSPFFSIPIGDIHSTDNPNGYWNYLSGNAFTSALSDGWMHISYTTSGSTATLRFHPYAADWVKPDTRYTLLVEFRNMVASGDTRIYAGAPSSSLYKPQMFTQSYNKAFTSSTKELRFKYDSKSDFTGCLALIATSYYLAANCSVDGDIRVSLYEGDYDGPYKPYGGSDFYTTKSELQVTAEGITSVVSTKVGNDEVISKINQSAETVKIQASKVEIDGTATFNAIKSQTDAAYDAIGAAAAAQTAAAADATTKVNAANSQEQLIYCSKASGTSSLAGTTTWVTDVTGGQNKWTLKRPQYSSSYPVLFVATQRKTVGGTVTCTTPQIDETTTVIDGGNIITGTVTANKLNAANINASGSLTIGALSSATQTDILNSNIEIGGTNYALDTATWNSWGKTSGITAANGILTFPSRTTLSWIYARSTTIPASEFYGHTWTLSFYYRSDDFSDTSGNPYITANMEGSATYGGSRTKYRAVVGANPKYVPTTEWQRVVTSFTPTDEAWLDQGSGTVAYVGVAIWSNTKNSFQIKQLKLERGNKATDWTPAPEDEASVRKAVYGTCSTAAGTAAKAVTCANFELFTGARIAVKFLEANTTAAPTLNVNGTGAKAIWYDNVVASASNPVLWSASTTTSPATTATLNFIYDGEHWVLDEKPPCYTASSGTTGRDTTASVAGALVVNGTTVTVRYTKANTSATAKRLTLGSTGLASMYFNNAAVSATNTLFWAANTELTFVRVGAGWHLSDNGLRKNITHIDDNGISIHAANNPTTNHIQLNASGMEVFKGGSSVAQFGETARIGQASGMHTEMTSSEFHILDGASDAFSVKYETKNGYTHANLKLANLYNGASAYDIMSIAGSGNNAIGFYRPPVIAGGSRSESDGFTSLTRNYTSYGFTIEEAHYTANACSVTIPIRFTTTTNIDTGSNQILAKMDTGTSWPAPPTYQVRVPVFLAKKDWSSTGIGYATLTPDGDIYITSNGFAWGVAFGSITYTRNLADWS